NRLNISALRKFIKHHDYQLKFVIQDKTDLPEIEAVLKQLRPLKVEKENIYLMPQARTKQEHRRLGPLVAQMCIEKGYRYSPRLQIQLWSNRRGK
ncbi:MAG: hypothetical protein JW860_11535, partial [Sedimentisphaerales bacterium]|nr:hypothetical protein [Sedimentisphaerales bacterium]